MNLKIVPEILKKIRTGEKIIYRGHADKSWTLKPSIGRHFSGKWKDVEAREIKALKEFKNRSIPYIKFKPSNDIEWLVLMQHHGCSTRLLDFTTNPLIALFFASDPSVQADGQFIDAQYKYTHPEQVEANIFEHKNNFMYQPPHITERIIGQSGCFVFCKSPNRPIDSSQIISTDIPLGEKQTIRKELAVLGICNATLFPGTDGICKDLNAALIFGLQVDNLFY